MRRMEKNGCRNGSAKGLVPVSFGLLALGASAVWAANPVIPAWIDINAQLAAPVTSAKTATLTALDMIERDSQTSAGFDFLSRSFGFQVIFK